MSVEVVKVQVPLESFRFHQGRRIPSNEDRCLIYSEAFGKSKEANIHAWRSQEDMPEGVTLQVLSRGAARAVGGDPKAYFRAVFEHGCWRLIERVPDQGW